MNSRIYDRLEKADKEFVKAFKGWTVKNVGMTNHFTREVDGIHVPGPGPIEGGLTFILEKDGIKKKVILGYTELGEWIEHEEILK